MTSWIEKLNDAWAELLDTAPATRQYRSKLLSEKVSLNIYAAMRAIDNAPCLTLETSLPADTLFELSGMRLQLTSDDSKPLLVLSLEDESRRDLFTTICADVVSAATNVDGNEALNQFIARLDAWRQFLRTRQSGLSRSDTIGLIGELLILDQLLSINPNLLFSWEAPKDGLHDFYFDGHALEVKASLGPASSITISKLDQLDTTGLRRLDLFYVKMFETPNGRSLQNLVELITKRLPDEEAKRTLRNSLLSRGLMPDDNVALSSPKFELRSIEAFTVSNSFPRLDREKLHVAITEATYKLEVRALVPFSVDTNSAINNFTKSEHS